MSAVVERGALMAAEIAEQPARWLDLLNDRRHEIERAAAVISTADPQLLVMIARGSSDHAAQYGQYLAQAILGVPVQLATPATTTAHEATLRYPRAAAIAVSQSGESPDLIATVKATQTAGVPVVALTNRASSTLATLADVTIDLTAGVERSVAATKTYSAEILALWLLLSTASGRPWVELVDAVERAAEVAAEMLAEPLPVDLVARLAEADRVLAVGRGFSMSTAKETALKLMETCALPASGWSAADATHGPLGQVVAGTPVIAFTASPAGRASVLAFVDAARELGGAIAIIGDGPTRSELVSPALSRETGLAPELLPLVEIIPAQRLALAVSLARHRDPDRPPGLRKQTSTH
jgi:glucosamine--fructose-6-phosphate aminotransferase (isomerizing)